MSRRRVHLGLLLGIAGISTSALMVKRVGIGPTASAFWRMFYAAWIIYVVHLWRCRGSLSKGWEHRAWLGPATLAGLFLAIDMVIWHKSILLIGAGPATFLGNSQVIFVTLFGIIVLRERTSWLFPLVVPVVLLGLYLLIPNLGAGGLKGAAYTMGLTVGCSYGGYLVCLRYAKAASREAYPEVLSLAVIMLVTALGIGFWGLAVEGITLLAGSLKDHLIILCIALVANTLGWLLIKANLTRLPAHQGSLMLLMQPVLTTLWATLFFKEPIGGIQILGGLMVLGGIAAYQVHAEGTVTA